jgi:hypothetical protein
MKATIVISLAFLCLSGAGPNAQAVVPPPDGGYPNFTTAEGTKALQSLTTGVANTAVGWFSLKSTVDTSFNTAVGAGTLLFNTADQNTAVGAAALLFNTAGTLNTAVGAAALLNNTTGSQNTAIGTAALLNNHASGNTAIGNEVLRENTTGTYNTATGSQALFLNTTGLANTANGYQALVNNTTGDANTATGFAALAHNTTGYRNTANGLDALRNNDNGFLNTANGYQALLNNTGGSGNTAIGYLAGQNLTIGDDNICIANDGVAGDAGVIRIGRGFITATYIAGISGQTASGGTAVFVNADGKLGTSSSSARFKDDIKLMGKASEALFALQPVTFRYRKEIDPQGIPQFGLLAEEVEKVNADLVARDTEGKVNTVRYEQINAMLLNEFLKEHRKVQKLEATVEALTARLNEHDAKIQQVSNQLEIKSPDTRLAVSNR